MAVLMWLTNSPDLPSNYSKINLVILLYSNRQTQIRIKFPSFLRAAFRGFLFSIVSCFGCGAIRSSAYSPGLFSGVSLCEIPSLFFTFNQKQKFILKLTFNSRNYSPGNSVFAIQRSAGGWLQFCFLN